MARAAPGRISHVVVLMLENRSFDHLCGYRAGVDGLRGTESNLLDPSHPQSPSNPPFRVDAAAPYAVLAGQGPGHSIEATNLQLCDDARGPTPSNPARNDGFVRSYHLELTTADHVPNPTPAMLQVVMQSFAPERLPSLNALADAFCLCDRWYSEVPGPTQPNRLYVHAGTSFGYGHNVWKKHFDAPTIYGNLQEAGRSWAVYEFDHDEVREFTQVNRLTASFRRFEESFAADVQADRLPDYAFVLPRFLASHDGPANSQHAPEDARHGDHLVADVYEALRANDDVWSRSALVVTYDEHGGFYDHVAPPEGVPSPDGLTSPRPGDPPYAPAFDFTRLGLRVPTVIASPWVAAGKVDSTPYQHTSILATLKRLFGLPAFLTRRDASAAPFDHLFQELPSPRTDAPRTLPRAPLPALPPADDPTHPANHLLDRDQRDMLLGVHQLTLASHPDDPGVDALPRTQGEAHRFIRARYERHFGTAHGR